MTLGELLLGAIADAVFGYLMGRGDDILLPFLRDKIGQEPAKKAFKVAFQNAYTHLEQQHPKWIANQFDASFFQHEGAPILAQFLVRDGHPDASMLAAAWGTSLSLRYNRQRTFYIRDLEPIAADFLEDLAHALKSQDALCDLNNSRALEQMASDLFTLRSALGEERATLGTRRDYLSWLIDRNRYLDPRGTFQTQRQVQLRLDEVYVSLQAQRDEEPAIVDRRMFEEELAELEQLLTQANLPAEEVEDQRELLHARMFGHNQLVEANKSKVVDLAQVVTDHDHLIILGDPGSGKTTLVRYLTLMHAQALWAENTNANANLGPACFPFLLRIAEYAEEHSRRPRPLSDFLLDAHTLHECPKRGLVDLFRRELASGNCLILLDGLDEIVNADERRSIVQQIEDFVLRYDHNGNRFIITSRIAGYRSAPLSGAFAQYMVKDMNETQIKQFLQRWCQAVEDAETPEISPEERQRVAQREIDGIIQAIKNASGVRRLASNPLLLRILALIHRSGASLPQKRIALYKLATDTLARSWRSAQGVPESALVKDEYLTPMLSSLGYWLHVHKPTGIATEREVYAVLGKAWAQINDVLWDEDNPSPKIQEEVGKFLLAVREHTGLFVERAPRRYGFMHLTFEEYYAARFLVARRRTSAKMIRQHLHNPRWDEPILLALGFVGLDYPNESSDLVETAILAQGEEAKELGFVSSPYENLLGRDFLFALRCLADNIPVSHMVMKQLIVRLIDELTQDSGPARFNSYSSDLLRRYIPALRGCDCISILVPYLLNLIQSNKARERYTAIACLVDLGETSEHIVASLIKALDDRNFSVRITAIRGLEDLRITTDNVILALSRKLDDTNAHIRRSAIQSLAKVGQSLPSIEDILMKSLQSTDVHMRRGAAFGLARAKWKQIKPEIIVTFARMLHDDDVFVRRGISEGLETWLCNNLDIVTDLISALSDTDFIVRSNVIGCLEHLGYIYPCVVTALFTALSDVDRYFETAITLGNIGRKRPEIANHLLKVAQENSNNVGLRIAILLGLSNIGQQNDDVVAFIKKATQDTNIFVRLKSIEILGDWGMISPDMITILMKALKHRHKKIQRSAAKILCQFGYLSSDVLNIVHNVLRENKVSDDHVNFIEILGKVGDADVPNVELLLSILESKSADYEHCKACSQSLVLLGHRFPKKAQEIESRLLMALDDPGFNKVKRNGVKASENIYITFRSLINNNIDEIDW